MSTATRVSPGNFRPRAVRSQEGRDAAALADTQSYISRWLTVWVALSAVVILVVVVYLVFISNALSSINSGLAVAQRAVAGAGGHTKTLPSQIQGINTSLGGIDQALRPIPAQGNQIATNLTSIEGNLTSIDGSLKNTSPMLSQVGGALVGVSGSLVSTTGMLNNTAGSLVSTTGLLNNTSGLLQGITSNLNGVSSSLVDTSGVLTAVLGTAGQINATLVDANFPNGWCNAPETNSTYMPPAGAPPGKFSCDPTQLGVQNIHQRVAIANGVLAPAQTDLTNIIGGLTSVNGHLLSICDSTVIQLVTAPHGGTPKCPKP
jgi:hypothetical protein